jgi:hypothetical protein
MKSALRIAVLALVLGFASAGAAGAALFDSPPLDAQALDSIRGGFDAGPGLRVSFGVERATYVNGELMASSGFQIADVTRITAAEAAAAKNAFASTVVIRDGSVSLAPAQTAQALSTWVQNSLDGQTIRNLTTISTVTNSLSMLRSLNADASWRDALVPPPPGR